MRTPRPGDIALNEKGVLGLVLSTRPIKTKDSPETPVWAGIPLALGALCTWESKTPRILLSIAEIYIQNPPSYCPACGQPMLAAQRLPEEMVCRSCGFFGYSYKNTKDIWARFNWDEVRMLCDYAQRYARENKVPVDMARAIGATVGRLRKMRPEGAEALLVEDIMHEKFLEETLKPSTPGPPETIEKKKVYN